MIQVLVGMVTSMLLGQGVLTSYRAKVTKCLHSVSQYTQWLASTLYYSDKKNESHQNNTIFSQLS